MVSPEPGEVFMDSLIAARAEQPQTTKNDDVPDEEDFDDDRSDFTTESVDDPSLTDIYGLPELCPGNEQGVAPDIQPPENGAAGGFAENENSTIMAPPRMEAEGDDHPFVHQGPNSPPTVEDDPTIPKTRSLAHHQFMDHKVVFVSFDIETGGSFVEFSKSLPRW